MYALGTIAVNVTWMERRFNVGQNHSSMYLSIYLQPFTSYIARYWLEIATFSYPLAFNHVPIGIPGKGVVLRKLESWSYKAVKTV